MADDLAAQSAGAPEVQGFQISLGAAEIGVLALVVIVMLLLAMKIAYRLGFASGTLRHVNTIIPEEVVDMRPPIFKMPKSDVDAGNGITEVSFKDVDSGVEVTVVFADEDRLNKAEDWIYDHIRLPLFGRAADIETLTVLKNEYGKFDRIRFEGTYAGDQTWKSAFPKHLSEDVSLDEFEKEDGRVVIWVNVWNHLFGPKNNNTDMEHMAAKAYKCVLGSRKDVDDRYCGLISKVA